MIFWKLWYKISTFWEFFLEFFGLENKLTLQDHYYTRAITLILGIERNKKIIFQWGFSCKTCKNSYEFLAPQDKILARFLTLAENTICNPNTPRWHIQRRNLWCFFLFGASCDENLWGLGTFPKKFSVFIKWKGLPPP